jgi:hypothetical protein
MKSRRKSKVKSRKSRKRYRKSKVKSRKSRKRYRKSRVKSRRKSHKRYRKSRVKSRRKSRLDNGWKEDLWNYIKSSPSNFKNYIKRKYNDILEYIGYSKKEDKKAQEAKRIKQEQEAKRIKQVQQAEATQKARRKQERKEAQATQKAKRKQEAIEVREVEKRKQEVKEVKEEVKEVKKFIGTRNLGNTCFLNATNILIANIPNIIPNLIELESKNKFIISLIAVLKNIKENKCNEKDIEQLVNFVRLIQVGFTPKELGPVRPVYLNEDYKQEDATEYFNKLLEQIDNILGYRFLDNFILRTITTRGGHVTNEEKTPEKKLILKVSECNNPCSIQSLLNLYLQENVISSDIVQSYMITTDENLKYIIIELNRDKYIDGKPYKIKTPVEITNIKIPVFINNNKVIQEMKPKVVVVHEGTGPTSGHYVSYLINDDNIIYYSDIKVETINETDINRINDVKRNAYLILYLPI